MVDIIREVLYKGDYLRYKRELKKQKISFQDWVKAKKSTGTKEFANVPVISYEEIKEESFFNKMQSLPEQGFCVFAGEGGRLSPNALALFARFFENRPDIMLVYGDEAVEDAEGNFLELHFKPCWSPDTFLSAFYIGSVFAVKNELLKRMLGKADRTDGKTWKPDAFFYDLAVEAGGFTRRQGRKFPIGHIDEILFYRRPEQDPYYGRGYGVRNDQKIGATGSCGDLISIIIPSKDHPEVLGLCLRTIKEKTLLTANDKGKPISFEIIVVDNGSSQEHKEAYEGLLREYFPENSTYLYHPMDFNFSRMCNLGAEKARGDYLLFLNDDIEIASKNWLTQMHQVACRDYAGAVGIKLLYPGAEEKLIQHVGITNLSVGPTHKLQRLSDLEPHYYDYNRGIQDRIGVTAACLMVQKDKFREAGGFFEGLAVAFNDVDLNFTLFEKGYYNVVCNDVYLYHHESLSRGNDLMDEAKTRRLLKEMGVLKKRHKGWEYDDPFYSKHLSSSSMEEIAPEPEIPGLSEETLKFAKNHDIKTLGIYREDGCILLTVDYAGEISRLFSEVGYAADKSGFCVKGYGIIVGSDNACYTRYLLLRNVVNHDLMYAFDIQDWYRPDVESNLHGQVNVAMTGFKCRIPEGILPKGEYEIGMLVAKHLSRERIVNWNEHMTLEVE